MLDTLYFLLVHVNNTLLPHFMWILLVDRDPNIFSHKSVPNDTSASLMVCFPLTYAGGDSRIYNTTLFKSIIRLLRLNWISFLVSSGAGSAEWRRGWS